MAAEGVLAAGSDKECGRHISRRRLQNDVGSRAIVTELEPV